MAKKTTKRITLQEPKPQIQAQQPKPDLVPQAAKSNQDSDNFETGTKVQFKPVGTSGTEIFAGYFNEEYLQQLRGRRGAKVWDEIRRSESQVAMLMNAIMNPIKSGTWEFEAAPDVADAEKHKLLIEHCAKNMIDWETFMHEALTMIIFGHSVFEIIMCAVINDPKFGTFNGLKGLAFRSQKTIEKWNLDPGTGDLKTISQWVQGDLATGRQSTYDIMAEFLLIFTVQKEGDNYEGISALRPMYGAWFRKNLYLKIMAIGIEKNAIGTPMGTVPSGKQKAEELAEFKTVLSNFAAHESAYLLKPEGWNIEILQNNFDPSKLKDAVVMENTEMINSVVANFLALGTSGGGGSFALGSDLSDFFLTGIQTYANIICGVWNRKLIPQLIKLNFGPQSAYPKLKATGINDKAGKELAEILSSLLGSKAIKADMKLEEFLRKQYSLPKADEATAREQDPPKPMQFNERRIKLAEKSYKQKWNANKEDVKEVMQEGLTSMLEETTEKLKRQYKSASPAAKLTLGNDLEIKNSQYKKNLQEALAKVANQSYLDARKETPKAKNVKLSESIKLAAPVGGFFDALPSNIKRIVKAQAGMIADTQAADLKKIVSFQYSSSAASTPDIDQIVLDIEAAALPTIEGSTSKGLSVDAAAGNSVSQMVNQARLEWFFEPEVLETIESFTFYNEDPISEICQELDGMTWDTNDPDLDRYSPPMHHNCKSRLVPNEKGAEGNPDIERGGTAVSQKALDSITLCETHYHLDFKNGKE